uniref:CCT domain-containing protein n=1 Tax=Aplanochytrium stocchinoi TaxID=215587 RepID=A0A7S3LIG6_9STRA
MVSSTFDWTKIEKVGDILSSPKRQQRARGLSLEFSMLPTSLRDLAELEEAMNMGAKSDDTGEETAAKILSSSSSSANGIRVKPILSSSENKTTSPYMRKFKYKKLGGKTPARRSPQNIERLNRALNAAGSSNIPQAKPRYTYNTSDRWDPIQPLYALHPQYANNARVSVYCKFTGAQLAFVRQPKAFIDQHRVHRTRLKQYALKFKMMNGKSDNKSTVAANSSYKSILSTNRPLTPSTDKQTELRKKVEAMAALAKKEEDALKAAQAKAAAAKAALKAAQLQLEQGTKPKLPPPPPPPSPSQTAASRYKMNTLNRSGSGSQQSLSNSTNKSFSKPGYTKPTISSTTRNVSSINVTAIQKAKQAALQKKMANSSSASRHNLGSPVLDKSISSSQSLQTKSGSNNPTINKSNLTKSLLNSSSVLRTPSVSVISQTNTNSSNIGHRQGTCQITKLSASRVGGIKRSTVGPKGKMIGKYTPEERLERIKRFMEKRKNRVWMKKVKYGCRKKLADSRPRVKGRFVPRSAVINGMVMPPNTSTSSAVTKPTVSSLNRKVTLSNSKTATSKVGTAKYSHASYLAKSNVKSKASITYPSAKSKVQPRYGAYTAKIQKTVTAKQNSRPNGVHTSSLYQKQKFTPLSSTKPSSIYKSAVSQRKPTFSSQLQRAGTGATSLYKTSSSGSSGPSSLLSITSSVKNSVEVSNGNNTKPTIQKTQPPSVPKQATTGVATQSLTSATKTLSLTSPTKGSTPTALHTPSAKIGTAVAPKMTPATKGTATIANGTITPLANSLPSVSKAAATAQ